MKKPKVWTIDRTRQKPAEESFEPEKAYKEAKL
jgi:hypothetical protein